MSLVGGRGLGALRGWGEEGASLARRALLDAAAVDLDAHCLSHGGFGGEGFVGGGGVGGVDDLDVVGLVLGHELVAGDVVEHGVHDGPLLCGGVPAALHLGVGEGDGGGAAEVHVEGAGGDLAGGTGLRPGAPVGERDVSVLST